MRTLLIAILIFPLLDACHRNSTLSADPETYYAEIDTWHNERLARLKAMNGWLNLAGLYWLQEGKNTFGSASSNTIIFPAKAPAFIGILELKGDSVYLRTTEVPVLLNDKPAVSARLADDASGKPDIMTVDHLAWNIIKRGTKYGIRLRDYNSMLANRLDHVPCYETNQKWRITADFKPFAEPEKQKVQTVIGMEVENIIPGELVFRINGKKMKLLPIASEDGWSLVFGDMTNGFDTYPAGRFMDIGKPDENNKVLIDFNKSYNPPCSFTPFATCQLPHPDNILRVKIEAGEKSVHINLHN